MLSVQNVCGIRIYKDARIAQLIVERLDTTVKQGYSGIYQGEGLSAHRGD
jgi:deoxycytidine triphosphate deaminase